MQAAQDWFDNIQEAKINAYMELYDTLLELGKGLDKADGNTVLARITDKSGQFISEVDKFMVYVSKEDETIMKKPVVVSQDARKSISEYYYFMQNTREMEAAINDENIFLDRYRYRYLTRQVQLPVVQVMVQTRSEEEVL